MKITLLVLIPITTVLAGCNQKPDSFPKSYESDSSQQIATIQNRASALAKGELERLAATEMIYRNQTFYFQRFDPVLGKTMGAFGKLYRQFTEFEVIDIVNSPSILRPVTIIVRFKYDVIGTKPELGQQSEGELSKIAQNNNNYISHGRSAVSLEYTCDKAGYPLEHELKILPRLNFWKDAEGFEEGEFILHAVQNQ